MRSIILLLILFSSVITSAQSNMEEIQNEIDRTVWRQFKAAFENLDAELLNDTYGNEVLRVTPAGIDTKSSFKARNIERFKMLKGKSAKVELDFWFESRYSNSNTSYEVGYFRISTQMEGKTSVNYGQFHIVLKKISGHWKITQDWDTTLINGLEIGSKEFERNGENRLY
jgi:ketosteroid isomerase-like protein